MPQAIKLVWGFKFLKRMNITALSFEEKVELLKELIDILDITLTAAYGSTGGISSNDIQIYDNTRIYIHTDICTG